ncbi:MAG: hypothetical protein B7Z53_05925 [Rhodospirillales bacterium 12-71-4]|nr:MAG: hypothetical protein B7Z53_05925 [Rhodospirillales bacterium 12-71-4]
MTIADLGFDHLRWLVEALLLLLIVAALPTAIRLDRALSALRRDRGALAESTRSFAEATREAEQVIARLRNAADGAGRGVAEQVRIATTLREDLRFLSERAETLADRLEAGLVQINQDPERVFRGHKARKEVTSCGSISRH